MRHMRRWFVLLCLLIGQSVGPGFAGVGGQAEGVRGQKVPSDRVETKLDAAALKGLKWRNIGPANTGGRISDIAVARLPGTPDAIYVGAASGGIFKSVDKGTSWEPIFDDVDGLISIGDIAVAPSNPNIIWAGTGEANNRQSENWGDGVYKSVDAGRTWKNMGLKDTRHVGRIVIDPANANTVYVAAVGHLWGPNAERGVFKTTDGGESWKKILFVDDNTGATDLCMDPQDPQTLFAATYQRQRKAWGFSGGGPGSGIYRTYDGGASWTKLTNGLPRGDKGRIGLDIYRPNGRVVYAIVEADPDQASVRVGGLFRSVDRGETWEHLNPLNPRPMYYSQIRIDPKDQNRIYMLGSGRGFYVSEDGGKTFRDIFSRVHSEDHALWVDPDDSNHLIVGGDGGVSISWNRGESWMFRDNLAVGQFYEIDVDQRDPYYVYGGLQDNGIWRVPSATRDRNGISNRDASNIGGGDGFYAKIDPKDSNTIYLDSQDGHALRVNLTTLERQAITPQKAKRGDPDYRWNWDTPILLSSFDSSRIYMGANVLFRSTDRGMSWTVISPDLTANIDRDGLEMMGRKITEETLSRHDGQATYSTLTTISESPLDPDVLYTGSDDGQLHVTRDGGAKWANLTVRIPNLPPRTYVSCVAASSHAEGRVFATFDGHYNDDYRPYVYVSEDYGQSWRSLSQGLPETSVNRIREHPRTSRLLFLAHEKGVSASIDGGANWISLNTNLPSVPVDDLVIHPRENDLVIGTHGRSIWILDDIGPLEALTPEVLASDVHLLPIKRARQCSIYSPQAWFGAGQFFAPNPDYGAGITYYLGKASADKKVGINIHDGQGNLIRKLEGPGERGLNRIFWDLRTEPSGPAREGRPGGGAEGARGLTVPPGVYKAVVDGPRGGELNATVSVEGDPLNVVSEEDRRRRQDALLDLVELQKSLASPQDIVRAAADGIESLKKNLAARAGGSPEGPMKEALGRVAGVADDLSRSQRELEGQLRSIIRLGRQIDGYSGRPTSDQLRQIDWAFEDAMKLIEELNAILQKGIPALFSELAAQNIWIAPARPIAPPVRKR